MYQKLRFCNLCSQRLTFQLQLAENDLLFPSIKAYIVLDNQRAFFTHSRVLANEGKLLPIIFFFFSAGGEKGGGIKSVLKTGIITAYCSPVTMA